MRRRYGTGNRHGHNCELQEEPSTENSGTRDTDEGTNLNTWVQVVSRRKKGKDRESKAVVSSTLSRNNPVI